MKHFFNNLKSLKKMILLGCFAMLIIAAALIAYWYNLNSIVTENTIDEMQEIALRCRESIEGQNDLAWELLSQLYGRLKKAELSTVQETCERLNFESAAKYYDLIYLVDDTGKTYSGTYLIEDRKNEEQVQRILNRDERFVLSYRGGSMAERSRDSLIYGISIKPFTVGGITFVGLYSIADTHFLEQFLQLESFSGMGYTLVFDSEGNYLINKDSNTGVTKQQNFYEELLQEYNYTEKMTENLKTQIRKKEHFNKTIKNHFGETIQIHFDSIENTDWTMILVVPKAVISQGSQRFVRLTLIMLVVVLAILIGLVIIIISLSSSTLGAIAEAKARSEFLASMSHEIRTPLNGIIGLNHLMQANLTNKDKLEDYLKKSANTEQYLLSLINDILDVQKLQAGKMEIFETPFSLNSLISDTETIMRFRIEEKNISFTVKSDIAQDALIGDTTRIQQILINILGNAQKFTDENGKIEFRISQKRHTIDRLVTTVFQIEDTGCGMTKEFQEKIFDSFSQERHLNDGSIKGTGLGMNISYLLSKQMGGDLSVTSRLGHGSCFTLVLHNRIASQEELQNILSQRTEEQSEPAKQLRILIAEDNELNAEILIALLQNAGHTAIWAQDGEEVVDLFIDSPENFYDVILMDIQMPKRNGYDAAKMIRTLERKDAKNILIFACTANTFREDVEMAVNSGMNDFIAKPIDLSKLMEKLKTAM